MQSIELSTSFCHVDWLRPQWPVPANVQAVCTTRAGGFSAPPYDSMNLGAHVGDDAGLVQRNRRQLEAVLGATPVFLDQVHGNKILELSAHTVNGQQADGALTQVQGVVCTVMVADCLPILICAVQDGRALAVGALHAGWRGLLGTAGHGVIEAFYRHLMPLARMDKAQPAIEFIAWLGPCIGPQAFEVGEEVRSAFVEDAPQAAGCFVPLAHAKWLANLAALARQRLMRLGITAVYGNDGSPTWCTVTNPLQLFSYRRDRISGRQAACIWLT